jgi:hypothetical protein
VVQAFQEEHLLAPLQRYELMLRNNRQNLTDQKSWKAVGHPRQIPVPTRRTRTSPGPGSSIVISVISNGSPFQK